MSAPDIVLDDPHWGRLTIDREALLDRLAEATRAVDAASIVAQYRNADGYPIQSPPSLALGGLSQVIDALIDQFQEAESEGDSRKAVMG